MEIFYGKLKKKRKNLKNSEKSHRIRTIYRDLEVKFVSRSPAIRKI
jgi:hypothetical protein